MVAFLAAAQRYADLVADQGMPEAVALACMAADALAAGQQIAATDPEVSAWLVLNAASLAADRRALLVTAATPVPDDPSSLEDDHASDD